jgi:hypothetical protein
MPIDPGICAGFCFAEITSNSKKLASPVVAVSSLSQPTCVGPGTSVFRQAFQKLRTLRHSLALLVFKEVQP